MKANKEAFQIVGETCPAVDAAASEFLQAVEDELRTNLDSFVERVKEQTIKLREALVDALVERNEARAERDAAQAEAEDLRNQLGALNAENQELITALNSFETS